MLKNLYLICGKSGSGKTYTVEKLHNEYGYNILCSYTTRQPRSKYDKDHYYVDLSKYYEDLSNDVIAADSCYEQNLYWSTFEQVKNSDLYVIDKTGIEKLKEKYSERPLVVIYLDATQNTRISRMRFNRGDSTRKINKRIKYDESYSFKGIKHLADFIVDANSKEQWEIVHNIIEKCEEVDLNGIN